VKKSSPARRIVEGWSAVASFSIAEDGRIVAGEKGGYRVCCWDAAGALAWSVPLQKHGRSSRYSFEVIVVVAGDVVLALPSHGKRLLVLDLATGKVAREHAIGDDTRNLALAPDGVTLAMRTSTETTVFEYPSLRVVAPFTEYCNMNAMAVSPNGKWLAVCGYEVHVYDLPARKHIATFEPPESPTALVFPPSSAQLVTGDDKQMLRVYDAEHGFVRLAEAGKNRAPGITALAVSPDGRFIAAGNELGTVVLHDAGTLAPVRDFKGHDPSVPDTGSRELSQVAFTPRGELVVSAPPKKQPAGLSIHTIA